MAAQSQVKKKPSDFIFGKMIGEGSFSNVFLAKEISTKKEYAIKVLEKRHILREKKTQYVQREKEVLLRLNHPFFIKLHFTFQDEERLYFGLSYARRGELLDYIKRLGCFDENCTRFYTAEIIEALEYLHSMGIIHRDLKPENILLNDEMHIQITDFGSAKILDLPPTEENSVAQRNSSVNADNKQRKNSFVGTAQYVSPEVLQNNCSYYSSDLWALGCIIYQLLSGQHPFWGNHEYQIFQKIVKLEYEIPAGFNADAKDLVTKLLVLDPTQRLGCQEMGGYDTLRSHIFLSGIDWETLHLQKPPELLPYLPANSENSENLWSEYKPGLDDVQLSQLLGVDLAISKSTVKKVEKNNWITDDDRRSKLESQSQSNEYHRFVKGNLILKQGLLDKRKGLFARRRMFLLTEGPRLFYVDPSNMVLKGEIPWSKELRPETKNFKVFFVHTPNRTYYLEDPEGNALKWCQKIEEVLLHYYGSTKNDS